jgi:hypothetical protein
MFRTKCFICTFHSIVASANTVQRRADDDTPLNIRGPEASRIAKKRAARRRDAGNE